MEKSKTGTPYKKTTEWQFGSIRDATRRGVSGQIVPSLSILERMCIALDV
ncbi:MAG TPA: hypothetical protein PLM80_00420 [Mesotoga sp.]|jgi:hypothetical protein|nr:hypothetical protein [Mesotoga sp.]